MSEQALTERGKPSPGKSASQAISTGKKLLFQTIAVGCGVVVGLLLGEAALRVAGFPAIGLDTGGKVIDWPIARTDRRGGSFPPGSWRLRHDDFDVDWTVNEHGFRERPPLPKALGEYRIGLLGDSFTAGHGVQLHERFGTLWQDAVRQDHGEVTVWNLATGLMGTANAADLMRGLGHGYDFDEVVLAFYAGNDLEDNRHWYQVELDTQGNPIPRATDPWLSFREWGRAHSRVLSVVGSGLLAKFGPTRPPVGVFEPARLEELWPYTEQALNELAAAIGCKPWTIWYLPSDAEWDDVVWRAAQAEFGYADADRFLLRQRLQRWADVHRVAMVDATRFLAGLSIEAIRFPRDPHWNALGHRLIAEGLAGELPAATLAKRIGSR